MKIRSANIQKSNKRDNYGMDQDCVFRNILYFFLSFQGIKNYVRSIMPEDFMSIKLGTAYVTILQLQEKSTYN